MKIFFIEDDAIGTMKLNRTISIFQVNHTIIQANNGEEALEILKDTQKIPILSFWISMCPE